MVDNWRSREQVARVAERAPPPAHFCHYRLTVGNLHTKRQKDKKTKRQKDKKTKGQKDKKDKKAKRQKDKKDINDWLY